MARALVVAALICLAAVPGLAQNPPRVTVPLSLCVSGRTRTEQVTMNWVEELGAYVGHSQAKLAPGMYSATVMGPPDTEGFRLLLAEAHPELWQARSGGWVAEFVRVGVRGPVVLWQDGSQPLRSVTLACEPNLASGKYYRLEPAPNYHLKDPVTCTDLDDRIQLTDGVLAEASPLAAASVGWERLDEAVVAIDLGREMTVSRVFVNLRVDGLGGAYWPASVKIDGSLGPVRERALPQPAPRPGPVTSQVFRLLGQWFRPDQPDPGGPASLRLAIRCPGQARYLQVRLLTGPSRVVCADEIEVY